MNKGPTTLDSSGTTGTAGTRPPLRACGRGKGGKCSGTNRWSQSNRNSVSCCFIWFLFDCSSVPVAAGGGAIYIFSGYPADVVAT